MLSVHDLVVHYGNTPVLTGLTQRFARGRVTALVGPNGCGKSTLLRAIMGFLPAARGEVRLEGQPMRGIGRRELARRVAYLPQECHCPDYMTLGELIELSGYARYSLAGGPSDRDRALFRQSLEIVGLADRAGSQMNTLSGGQRQRAWIAMMLAQDTEMVLLDEPVNHLDMKYQYAVMGLIRTLSLRHGKTVIVVLHDLNLATAFTDDVVMLADGQVQAAGPVGEIITAANVERVFGIVTDVFTRDGRLMCLPRLIDSLPVTA
ncbi:ABC transporter ATP-binding protein [Pleomorphomonas carboxyditropha]|uniref:ABC transporter n=1 Tax=Pleomorphomonas carboxyditropha TaxID=2023338 RepID=A0A2G9WXD2_9HYPH|nr:ABC transporter ATP-binding protein [Pleomorphomonas carboxyditropha]PIO99377.1 ABC transporter [Pleomorphomonas carboxyditropha]